MKLTTLLSCAYLTAAGVFLTVYALSGFDLLLFFCAGCMPVYRVLLSFTGIAAAWLVFWLAAFRPTKYVS